MSRDRITGLAVLAASLVLFSLTLGLKDSPLVPIGPGVYPRIILGLTVLLSLWLVLSDLRTKKKAESKTGKPNYALVALVFGVFGLYCGALPYLGYRISTFAFVAALQALLEPPRGGRGWLVVGVTALATTLLSYYVFERCLSVLMPRGRWTDF